MPHRAHRSAGAHRGLARSHVSRETRVPLSELVDKRGVLETEAFIRDGELTEAMEREWDAIAGTARVRIYKTGLVICAEDAQIAAIDHEIERLQGVRRARVNRNERRKGNLAFNMDRLDIRLVEGPLCTVTLQKNAVVASPTDPSSDQASLFASPDDEASSRATARNSHHVMVR